MMGLPEIFRQETLPSEAPMEVQRLASIATVGLCLVLVCSGLAAAHHSRAGVYQADDKRIEMKGVVAEWRWRNPHVFLVWDAKDSTGNLVRWTGELSSVTSMMSEKLNRNSFQAGQEITATVVPAKSGTPQGLLVKIVMADGSVPLDRTRGPVPD
jgi:hypothetical protein